MTEEQEEYHTLASQFAEAEFEPHAAAWDAEKHFPEEALRKAAELGFAGACRGQDGVLPRPLTLPKRVQAYLSRRMSVASACRALMVAW